jgi:hypothetical protein
VIDDYFRIRGALVRIYIMIFRAQHLAEFIFSKKVVLQVICQMSSLLKVYCQKKVIGETCSFASLPFIIIINYGLRPLLNNKIK